MATELVGNDEKEAEMYLQPAVKVAEAGTDAAAEDTVSGPVSACRQDKERRAELTFEANSGSILSMSELKVEGLSRNEKRKLLKQQKRRLQRQEEAARREAEELARMNDAEEQARLLLEEQRLVAALEEERKKHELEEQLWLQRERELEEEAQRKEEARLRQELLKAKAAKEKQVQVGSDAGSENEEDDDGPPEIIWQGNEIIVKKKKKKRTKAKEVHVSSEEDPNRPTHNPFPPQTTLFADIGKGRSAALQTERASIGPTEERDFGTEQDKVHCPFYLKTGACQFGSSCSRVHAYPTKSHTILIKNMYRVPGRTRLHGDPEDEGLEYDAEEARAHYVDFYEDVHPEFQKFGEIINFKVCMNSSPHLSGNVYVHYRDEDSAVAAFQATNGRYFASQQLICEFIPDPQWRRAICGQFLRSAQRVGYGAASCSRNQSCNFLHPFENPGGDYLWADWDGRPPRDWVRTMEVLFGSRRRDNDEPRLDRDSARQPRSDWPDHRTAESQRGSYARKDSYTRNEGASSWQRHSKRDGHFDSGGRRESRHWAERERDSAVRERSEGRRKRRGESLEDIREKRRQRSPGEGRWHSGSGSDANDAGPHGSREPRSKRRGRRKPGSPEGDGSASSESPKRTRIYEDGRRDDRQKEASERREKAVSGVSAEEETEQHASTPTSSGGSDVYQKAGDQGGIRKDDRGPDDREIHRGKKDRKNSEVSASSAKNREEAGGGRRRERKVESGAEEREDLPPCGHGHGKKRGGRAIATPSTSAFGASAHWKRRDALRDDDSDEDVGQEGRGRGTASARRDRDSPRATAVREQRGKERRHRERNRSLTVESTRYQRKEKKHKTEEEDLEVDLLDRWGS